MQVVFVREQEDLRPYLERVVSLSEPSIATEAQTERAALMLALALIAAYKIATAMADAGRCWASALLQARLARGPQARRIVQEVPRHRSSSLP